MDPHFLTDQQQNQRGRCSKDLLKMFEPDGPKRQTLSQVMKPGCTFIASFTNNPIRCGWLPRGRVQLCFNQVSRVGSDCFPFFNTQGPVIVDIQQQKSTLTATYHVETVPQGVIKSRHQQHPTVGTSKTLLLHGNASATKPRSL